MEKYPIGKMLPIFINKGDSSICTYKVKETLNKWYAGIVLLSLAGLIVLIIILYVINYQYKKFVLSKQIRNSLLYNNTKVNYNSVNLTA